MSTRKDTGALLYSRINEQIRAGFTKEQIQQAFHGNLPGNLNERESAVYNLALRLAKPQGPLVNESFEQAKAILGIDGVAGIAHIWYVENRHMDRKSLHRQIALDGIAVIVGSGSGIGREAAFSIAEAGAAVIVFADMNETMTKASSEESKKYASNKSYRTTTFKMNVQDDKSVQDMVDYVVKEFGRLDYVVNVVGVDNGVNAPIAETDIDNFDRIMRINARGNLVCICAQVAAIAKADT
ncbi:hypothetical protein CIB48_g3540 [Xylaria polymorpha]|nr:hypothetical protein CIB48_g3540 [Xylaria polymorpha]